MNCEILDTLYVRSNGDIPCNDDLGERLVLGSVLDAKGWSIDSVFQSPPYATIRRSFARGQVPWPELCPCCAFLRTRERPRDALRRRRIHKVQVEPALACNLRCPCCSQRAQAASRPAPHLMPTTTFATVLRSLHERRYRVGEIEYCGQGEPLMNREFPRFVELARASFPHARQRLITNGNFEYRSATGGQRLDEIFVSCDGYFQDSYAKYRVNGDVSRALRFMRDAPRVVDGRRQKMIWKYVLFEFNDGDDEIRLAQDAARAMAIDVLLFVFTHSLYKSRRFTAENAAAFPIRHPNVSTNATPIHYRRAARGPLDGARRALAALGRLVPGSRATDPR